MPVVCDVLEKDGKRCAVHVRRSNEFAEEAYFINHFQGRVTSWRQSGAGACGFIAYLDVGQKKSIFFHISDVNSAEDGIQYEPCDGCLVDFERGVRYGKEIAKDVVVLEWPQVEQTSDPEPVPITEPSSVLLKPENRTKTLLELIQQKQK